MSESEAEAVVVAAQSSNRLRNGVSIILNNLIDIISGIVTDVPRVGLQSILSGIFMIFSWIIKFMTFLFTQIIPFLLKYIGIPLFILGAILALIFFGGHMFFIVALMVGVYLYIKGIYNLTFNIPVQSKDMEHSGKNRANTYKIK